MGFRNPITQISASAITPGILPDGVVLPAAGVGAGELGPDVYARRVVAGALDGTVITGATLRTAAAGRRLQIDNADRDRLKFYSGDAAEVYPGVIAVDVQTPEQGTNARRGRVVLQPPAVRPPVASPVALTLTSDRYDGAAGGLVDVVAPGGFWLNGVQLDGSWLWYVPEWGSTGASKPSVGNGTLSGRYKVVGKTCTAVIVMTIGTAGASGGSGTWAWSLPIAAAGSNVGSGWLVNPGLFVAGLAGRCNGIWFLDVFEGRNLLQAGYTLGAGATLMVQVTYEIP